MSGLYDELLGDVLCTASEAAAAEGAVRRMVSTYNTFGQPAPWRAPVVAIVTEWDAWSDQNIVLRSWSNCQAKGIGQRAEKVTIAMSAAKGSAPVPGDPQLAPGPSTKVGAWIKDLLIGAVVVGGVLLVARSGRSRPALPSPARQRATTKRGRR